MLTLFTVRLVT